MGGGTSANFKPDHIPNTNTYLKSSVDLFLSHDWGVDQKGRPSVGRVRKINDILTKSGFTTWFDDVDSKSGNYLDLSGSILQSIEAAHCIVIFLTNCYIQRALSSQINECNFQFAKIQEIKKQAAIIPVLLEDGIRNESITKLIGNRTVIDIREFEYVMSQRASLIQCAREAVNPHRASCCKLTSTFQETKEADIVKWLQKNAGLDNATSIKYSVFFKYNGIISTSLLQRKLQQTADFLDKIGVTSSDCIAIHRALEADIQFSLDVKRQLSISSEMKAVKDAEETVRMDRTRQWKRDQRVVKERAETYLMKVEDQLSVDVSNALKQKIVTLPTAPRFDVRSPRQSLETVLASEYCALDSRLARVSTIHSVRELVQLLEDCTIMMKRGYESYNSSPPFKSSSARLLQGPGSSVQSFVCCSPAREDGIVDVADEEREDSQLALMRAAHCLVEANAVLCCALDMATANVLLSDQLRTSGCCPHIISLIGYTFKLYDTISELPVPVVVMHRPHESLSLLPVPAFALIASSPTPISSSPSNSWQGTSSNVGEAQKRPPQKVSSLLSSLKVIQMLCRCSDEVYTTNARNVAHLGNLGTIELVLEILGKYGGNKKSVAREGLGALAALAGSALLDDVATPPLPREHLSLLVSKGMDTGSESYVGKADSAHCEYKCEYEHTTRRIDEEAGSSGGGLTVAGSGVFSGGGSGGGGSSGGAGAGAVAGSGGIISSSGRRICDGGCRCGSCVELAASSHRFDCGAQVLVTGEATRETKHDNERGAHVNYSFQLSSAEATTSTLESTFSDTSNRSHMRKCECVERVLWTMVKHRTDAVVAQWGCRLLSLLLCREDVLSEGMAVALDGETMGGATPRTDFSASVSRLIYENFQPSNSAAVELLPSMKTDIKPSIGIWPEVGTIDTCELNSLLSTSQRPGSAAASVLDSILLCCSTCLRRFSTDAAVCSWALTILAKVTYLQSDAAGVRSLSQSDHFVHTAAATVVSVGMEPAGKCSDVTILSAAVNSRYHWWLKHDFTTSVLSTLSRHHENEYVAEAACLTIGNLTSTDVQFGSELADRGACSLLLITLKRHVGNATLFSHACFALYQLLACSSFSIVLVLPLLQSGAIDTVKHAIIIHISAARNRVTATGIVPPVDVRSNCNCDKHSSWDGSYPTDGLSLDFCVSAMKLMSRLLETISPGQQQGTSRPSGIAVDEVLSRIVLSGLCEKIVAMMDAFLYHEIPFSYCCTVVSSLARLDRSPLPCLDRLGEAHVATILTRGLRQYKPALNSTAFDAACVAVVDLTRDSSLNLSRFVQSGIASVLPFYANAQGTREIRFNHLSKACTSTFTPLSSSKVSSSVGFHANAPMKAINEARKLASSSLELFAGLPLLNVDGDLTAIHFSSVSRFGATGHLCRAIHENNIQPLAARDRLYVMKYLKTSF